MNLSSIPRDSLHSPIARLLLWLDRSAGFRLLICRAILLFGILVWIAVQGSLSLVPLWTRALPPEIDDSLTYVLKSRQMKECFKQDCPALLDLRMQHRQSQKPTTSAEVREEIELACSRIFPFYHPLFSLILLGLNKFGLDWMTAYKIVWTAGPFFFVMAFSYLLSTLWGPSAAGIALGLLAFKVFPDTGLHHVVPSNLAMAMAVIVFARIISRKGKALWTLTIGSFLMSAIHSIGMLYSVMAVFIALAMSGFNRKKIWIPGVIILLVIVMALVIPQRFQWPAMAIYHLLPQGDMPFLKMAVGAGETMIEVITNIVRLQEGLFGSIPVFCGAIAIGVLTALPDHRKTAVKMILVYLFFMVGMLFFVSSHPADIIFRMWIPFVVILFGAVGQAVWDSFKQSWRLLIGYITKDGTDDLVNLRTMWPVVILALLLGYCLHMTISGGEQVYATIRHTINRQPLEFNPSQPERLLSMSAPEDRVLYTSMIIMPYYFIHGAMELGAVYYHPSMQGTEMADEWLNRPDLRFAVTYNPTVYHPSFEGIKENNRWESSPDFRYSPLSKRRIYGPISRNGMIPAADFKWIEVKTNQGGSPTSVRLLIKNPGKASMIKLMSADGTQRPCTQNEAVIPSQWSGWIKMDLKEAFQSNRIRIVLPEGECRFLIAGIVFDDDPLHWPWFQKADISFMFRDENTSLVTRSFDPNKILPAPLNSRRISVLDDNGSSVLFEIHRQISE